jgi:abortive infection bacteriophage resistance protein
MKDVQGIKFNIINEYDAEEFLKNNNYYFKIKSYAKNYNKYDKGINVGKYVNLEFAYLKELSILDMHLRKYIIKITLDIEHFLRTQLLRDCSENDNEDGYGIIKDFFIKYPYIEKNINDKNNKNSVCGELIVKYQDDFAIWNIAEVLSFGDFIKLYEMYYRKYPCAENMCKYLWSVKFLRNAAAHNSCLLNSLKNPYSTQINLYKDINTFISKIDGISSEVRKRRMSNPIVNDLVVTLYVFNNLITSEQIKKHSMAELKNLIDIRFTKNKNYFEKNQIIVSYYKFIKIIVDYFYCECI